MNHTECVLVLWKHQLISFSIFLDFCSWHLWYDEAYSTDIGNLCAKFYDDDDNPFNMDNPFGIMHIDIKNVNQVQEDVPKQKGFNVNKKIRIDMD